MGDEPYRTQRETSTKTSSQSSTSGTSPHRAAYASQRARMLFGCYRRGDANDPETYVAAIAAVLARYEPDLIREVTDPNTGIHATEKHMTFMPNVGELKVYCESLAARRDRLRNLGARRVPDPDQARIEAPKPQPGDLANVFVAETHARYSHWCEWAKSSEPRLWKYGKSSDGRPGIWIAHNALDSGPTRSIGQFAKQAAE